MSAFDPARLAAVHTRELARFRDAHPASAATAARAASHFLFGVPMHWMRDWPTPYPVHVARASGRQVVTVDGVELVDFCLGDTGAMFGHSPPAVVRAVADQAARGLTTMLPGADVPEVGERLAATFGLPRWQLALSATDANRFVLRWARAVTDRPKVLVFDGCYHGTVDDTLVDMRVGPAGRHEPVARASLLGQVHDLALGTAVVPFNDLDAVEAALGRGDIAAVLTEPALTNCGLVLPAPGFLEGVQAACRRHGALLVLDETHTISAGLGGLGRQRGLHPDFLVVGKAIAGGVPCAVYGFTHAVALRMAQAKQAAPEGHSGIGTTLSASLLAVAALRATLAEVMTPAAYAQMQTVADGLQAGLDRLIASRGLPWSVARIGARLELQFCPQPPRDAAEARAAMDARAEAVLHLYLLNRGLLLTPFHCMALVSPQTTAEDAHRLATAVDAWASEVSPGAGA